MVHCFSVGLAYGFIFGLMDIEDDTFVKMRKDFLCEEQICLPIGIIGGIVAGMANEVLRTNVRAFLP